MSLVCFIGCNGDPQKAGNRVGGPCEYTDIYGQATITEIREADPKAYNCKDAVEVIFTFTPDDPQARNHYRFPGWPDNGLRFTVGAGMNPPKTWAQNRGLLKGTMHRCIRSEIIRGACTPVVFTFPDIDLAGWEDSCF